MTAQNAPGLVADPELLVYMSDSAPDFEGDGFTTVSLRDHWSPEVVERVASASELILVDPISFPYEAMTEVAWEVPITVILPDKFEPETVADLLAEPLMGPLTFFDRLVTDDEALWTCVKDRFRLGESQRLRLHGRDLHHFLDDQVRLRKLIEAANRAYERPLRQVDRWALRTRLNKRVHSKQRAALEEQVREARESLPRGVAMKVAHFGVGVGRFLELYRDDEVVGLDTTGWVTEQAEFSFEWPRFIVLGPGRRSPLPSAAWDLTVATHLVAGEPAERRRALLQEMSRITRPGGRIVILDDVCGGEGIDTRTLVEEVFDVTGGSVTLVDAAALRYGEAGSIDDVVIALMSVEGRRA